MGRKYFIVFLCVDNMFLEGKILFFGNKKHNTSKYQRHWNNMKFGVYLILTMKINGEKTADLDIRCNLYGGFWSLLGHCLKAGPKKSENLLKN